MYSKAEEFSTLASVAFKNALQDATMLQPTGLGSGKLFPPGVFDIRLGGDAGMVASTRTVDLPLTETIITIGRPYGIECGYTVGDPGDQSSYYVDMDIWIPFSVWDNSADDQDDTERALLFARDRRVNVFSAHGLSLQVDGHVGAKPRPNSPITGLVVTDYRWRFFYSRSSAGISIIDTAAIETDSPILT